MRAFLLLLLTTYAAQGELLDRSSIVIGHQVIKSSDIDEDIRVTSFLNHASPDFSAAARKQAASRLIDQALIREQVRTGEFRRASVDEAVNLLASLRSERFKSDAEFQAALTRNGISEEQLRQRLLWQLTALRFIDAKFGAQANAAGNKDEQINQMLNSWLDQSRKDVRIDYLEKSLQ